MTGSKKIMYRLGGYKALIEPVEVVDETDKTIVILVQGWGINKPNIRRRFKRASRSDRFFDTWQEAKDHLISNEQSNLDYHIRATESSRKRLEELKALKP